MRFLRRIWYFVSGKQRDADLADEMAFHREMKRQELRNRGVADVDLEMATTQALGNALAARERAHDVWVWREHVGALDSALTDIT
jgi:hypothetical protein